MVLTEFIDARGLHEATTQIEAILADAETTGTLKARAESHLYYLRSLEGTLSPEVLGPLDIPCRTLVRQDGQVGAGRGEKRASLSLPAGGAGGAPSRSA